MFDDLGVATAIRCDDGRPCHASLDERVREAFVERIEYVHIRILHRRERIRMTERPCERVITAERIFCARFKRLPLGTIADNCDREFLPFLSHDADGIQKLAIALPWHEASDRYHERPWKCPQSLHDLAYGGEFDRIVDDLDFFRPLPPTPPRWWPGGGLALCLLAPFFPPPPPPPPRGFLKKGGGGKRAQKSRSST